jgi:glycosyltransferase involved in cell wall biosynthesis
MASHETARPEILAAGATRGGVADVFRRVVLELRRYGHDVEVITFEPRRTAAMSAASSARRALRSVRGARTVHVEFGSNDHEAFWFALIAVLMRRDCVIVAHDYPKLAHVPSAGLVPAARRRLSALVHRLIAPVLDPLLIRIVIRRAGVLCVFGQEAQRAWQGAGAAAVEIIPHGSDPHGGNVPPSHGECVLFAGFLGPHKGLDTLLQAWARTHQQVDLPLVIAGGVDPPHAEWLHTLERQFVHLANQPRFVGAVQQEEDFQSMFDRAAIVVLPYRFSSPASGVLTRAMAAGRPVIATPVRAATNAIVHGVNGILVPMDDADALADALLALYRAPEERDRLGASAVRTMAEQFSWQSHIEGLERAYRVAQAR